MSNIKISSQANKIAPKVSELTQQEIQTLIAKSQKKRFPAPAPQTMVVSERLRLYNSVLSKIDPTKIIRVIPNPTITLTPAAPRNPDGKGSIGLETRDDSESCYWDTDPKLSVTGFIQMPNFVDGYIYLTFETEIGANYALQLPVYNGFNSCSNFYGYMENLWAECSDALCCSETRTDNNHRV